MGQFTNPVAVVTGATGGLGGAVVHAFLSEGVLTDCGGNVSQAAKLLGLHRRSLQRKLSKYPPRE